MGLDVPANGVVLIERARSIITAAASDSRLARSNFMVKPRAIGERRCLFGKHDRRCQDQLSLAKWHKALQLVGVGMAWQFGDGFDCDYRSPETGFLQGPCKCLLERTR
jgi:hypothetical protein